MQRRERFDANLSSFEGDRPLVARLPEGARVTTATFTLSPWTPPGAPPFEERITFTGDAGTWGATQATASSGQREIDFHHRRTVTRLVGSNLANATLSVDLGGVYALINERGGIVSPSAPDPFVLAVDGLVPNVTTTKLLVTPDTGSVNPVSQVVFRSSPSNVTVRLGAQPVCAFFPGELTGPVTTPDLATMVNQALAGATVENGMHQVPFVVSTATVGRVLVQLDLEFVLQQSALPDGLDEASFRYDHSGTPPSGSAALSLSLPAGARLVPGPAEPKASGAFDKTRVAFGPIGETAMVGVVAVDGRQSVASPLVVEADVDAVSVDLLVASVTPTASLRLDVVDDTDGKPWNEPLLPTLTIDIAREPSGVARWVNLPVSTPFPFHAGRRYWIVLQVTAGEATWSLLPAAPPAPDSQRSLDGGLSWRDLAVGSSVTAGAVRLRRVPDRFTMPLYLDVGVEPHRTRVDLDRFAPLGQVDVDLDAPEVLEAITDHLAEVLDAAPAVPDGIELLDNGDFTVWRPTSPRPTGAHHPETSFAVRRLAVSADGCAAYVAGGADLSGGGVALQVSRLDVLLEEADSARPTPAANVLSIDGVACSADGEHGYVMVDGVRVLAFSAASFAPVSSTLETAGGRAVALAPGGETLYVACAGSDGPPGRIVAVPTGALEGGASDVTGPVCELPEANPATMALSADGATLFVVTDDGALLRIDTATMTATPATTSQLPDGPVACALGGGGDRLVVVHSGPDVLSVVELASGLLRIVGLGADEPTPAAVAVSGDGSFAYVALRAADAVAEVDLAARRVTRRIPVGTAPNDIAITPDGGRLLVADDSMTAGVETMTVLVFGVLVPDGWTVTAGIIAPVCLPDQGRLTVVGRRPDRATPTATAALAQVVAVLPSVQMELTGAALALSEGGSVELHWYDAGGAAIGVDAVAVAAVATNEAAGGAPRLRPFRLDAVSPTQAAQVEVRVIAPAGVLVAIDTLSLRARVGVLTNEQLTIDGDTVTGWTVTPAASPGFTVTMASGRTRLANPGPDTVSIRQTAPVHTGVQYIVTVDVGVGSTTGARAQLAIELTWSNGTAPLGQPARLEVSVASATTQSMKATAPAGAMEAELAVLLPPGAAVEIDSISMEPVALVEVPLSFAAESTGHLAVVGWTVSYDVEDVHHRPHAPTGGLRRPGRPDLVPGEGDGECCYCVTCEAEHELVPVGPALGATGPAIRWSCSNCGSDVAVGGEWVPPAPVAPLRVTVPPSSRGEIERLSRVLVPETSERLMLLSGIGPRTAQRLRVIGITSLADLATVRPSTLATVPGVSQRRAQEWISAAARLIATRT